MGIVAEAITTRQDDAVTLFHAARFRGQQLDAILGFDPEFHGNSRRGILFHDEDSRFARLIAIDGFGRNRQGLGVCVELLPSESGGVKEGDSVILMGGYGLGDNAQIQTNAQTKPQSAQ